MNVVFHGANAASFLDGFAALLDGEAEISRIPDILSSDEERNTYRQADALIGVSFDASLPMPGTMKLFHVPGAGHDGIDLALLPSGATVCNCFGHEQAIAEYVMSALLARQVPLTDADEKLRRGDWAYWAGAPERAHGEMSGGTVGLLGFGHIGKAIAKRAKAFEMQVHVANRSHIAPSELVDRTFTLDELDGFWESLDALICSLPLVEATRGLVGADALRRMRPHAVVINVGRGPVIDEQALFDALNEKRIGGAVIDTWYVYPSPGDAQPQPSRLPFHTLPNIVMTPHMSGWTRGTIHRRQVTMAGNINRLARGEALINVVRHPQQ